MSPGLIPEGCMSPGLIPEGCVSPRLLLDRCLCQASIQDLTNFLIHRISR